MLVEILHSAVNVFTPRSINGHHHAMSREISGGRELEMDYFFSIPSGECRNNFSRVICHKNGLLLFLLLFCFFHYLFSFFLWGAVGGKGGGA